VSLHRAPPAPFEASAILPPPANARRHQFAGIRVTRNRRATSRSLAPASISSAAASRTYSRRARSSGGQPATIGIPHHYGIPHATPAVSRVRNAQD
jgi:hypothetical protein